MKTLKVILLLFFLSQYTFTCAQDEKTIEYLKEIELIKDEIKTIKDKRKLAKEYYLIGYKYNDISQLDSAYKYISRSKDLSLQLKDTLKVVKRMYSLGKLESENELYYRSDSTIVQALRLLGSNKDKFDIAVSMYNTLGINANLEKNYKEAVRWFNLALKNVKDPVKIIRYKNNIANNLISSESYSKAIQIYDSIKLDSYFDSIPKGLKGKVLDNYAYAKLLKGEQVTEADFLEGQKLKKEEKDIPGLFTNYSYLNYFYEEKGNKQKAKHYAYLMYDLAVKYSRPNDKIFAIDKILALEPSSNLKKLSLERSFLRDSVFDNSDKKRNQFATTIYSNEEEAKKRLLVENALAAVKIELARKKLLLEQQKRQQQQLIFLVGISFVSFLIYFFYKREKTKKEKMVEVYKTETRLAKKIHDELANDVYLAMNKVQQNESIDDSLLKSLEKIYLQTRNISHENSPVLTGLEFESFFKQLLADFSTDECRIMSKGISEIDLNKFSRDKQIVIYRVFQELLINMKKYSNASLVVISFSIEKGTVHVTYKDNGIGINTLKLKNGLQNMETRIKSIGGSVTFDSEAQKGFQVMFQFKK
ncbi:sensor histidine kinase [Tenacibaculum sp. TC6]|uniref:sensor histidine kinase n=1 Tax=Tenacibaculum sp. TC6 TaxID=3423223 RepID=UPI003D35BD6C